jgi:RimJ/RimL family protein N-acetyltransferase
MTAELLTKRLLLRRFRESDRQALHPMLADPLVTEHMPVDSSTEEGIRWGIQYLLNSQDADPPRHCFAVTLRADNTRSDDADAENPLIGACFISIRPAELRQGEITYLYARPYWGRGYATEAGRAVLAYGFRELDLHRIYATCRPDNLGSARVLEKIGMRYEGHLVQHRWMKGRWQDSLLYAILDHEWQALSSQHPRRPACSRSM